MYSAPAIKQGTLPQVITLNECDPIAVKNCLKEKRRANRKSGIESRGF